MIKVGFAAVRMVVAAVVVLALAACAIAKPSPDPSPSTSATPLFASDSPTPTPSQPVQLTLPVAATQVLRVGEDHDQDVRIALHSVRRVDGGTVLEWSVTPLATGGQTAGDEVPEDIDIGGNFAIDLPAIHLIDAPAGKLYRPLWKRSGNNAECICIPWFGLNSELKVAETRLLQIAFPELPTTLQAITVNVANVPLVTMPISPKGQIPVGAADPELAAPAEPAAAATKAIEFRYPLKNELSEPSQRLSLVVNSVSTSSAGTTLALTVTAKTDWANPRSGPSLPISEPGLVSIWQDVSGSAANGPGLRPSSATDAKTTRALHATDRHDTRPVHFRPKGSEWQECLCTTLQGYGDRMHQAGKAVKYLCEVPAPSDWDTGS